MSTFMFPVVKDVKMYWAKVFTPTDKFDKSGKEYSVQCFISKAAMLDLKKIKINKQFKPVDDDPTLAERYPECAGMYAVRFNAPDKTSAGKDVVIEVMGAEDAIGNGSTADIQLIGWEGKGLSAGKVNVRLNKIKVTDLVKYDKPQADTVPNPF